MQDDWDAQKHAQGPAAHNQNAKQERWASMLTVGNFDNPCLAKRAFLALNKLYAERGMLRQNTYERT